MANILMWAGIVLIVSAWLMLAWQAAKRFAAKDELEKFPQKRKTMQLHRGYCWLIMIAGGVLLLIAILI